MFQHFASNAHIQLFNDSKSNATISIDQANGDIVQQFDTKIFRHKHFNMSNHSDINLQSLASSFHLNSLKFIADEHENIEIAPTGLILLSKSQRITQVSLNKSFSTGIHCWEFYCPLSCSGITIGIKNDQRRQETFEFTSSTPRFITLKLDMNAKVWKCWINNTVPNRKPVRGLSQSVWTPFIRIKQKGNIVILNPYVKDPQNSTSNLNILRLPTQNMNVQQIKAIDSENIVQEQQRKQRKLLKLNEDTLGILEQNKSLKLIYRNLNNNQFQFDQNVKILKNKVQIKFSKNQKLILQRFSSINNINFIKFIRQNQQSVIEGEISQILTIFNNFSNVCDSNLKQLVDLKTGTSTTNPKILPSQSEILSIYKIFLSKLEELKPYLSHGSYQESLISQFEQEGRWGIQSNFFKNSEVPFTIPKSTYQNNLPPLKFNNEIKNISSTKNYLLIQTQKLEIYNYELIPFKVMELDLKKGFNKVNQIKKYRDIVDSLKKRNINQPSIYKILSNCLIQAKKIKKLPKEQKKIKQIIKAPQNIKLPQPIKPVKPVKPVVEQPFVDLVLLETLVAMGFSLQKSKKALIETKNVSAQVALEAILNMPNDEPVIKQRENIIVKTEWQCKNCTYINLKRTICQMCNSPAPIQQQTTTTSDGTKIQQKKEEQKLNVNEERISNNIEQPLLKYFLIETNIVIAPLLLIGLFKNKIRIRLIGPNPTYHKRFYIKNQKGFIDYSNFSFCENVYQLEQKPIRCLQNLFVGNERPNTTTFGWIIIEDQDINIQNNVDDIEFCQKKNEQSKIILSLIFKNISKQYELQLKKQNIYVDTLKSLNVKPIGQKQYYKQVEKRIEKSHPQQYTLEYVFTQNINSNPKPLLINNIETAIQSTEISGEYLPLVVQQGPMGCNMHYPVCSILYPVTKSFLSNYPYKLVFRHLHNKKIVVDSIIIEKIAQNKNVKSIKEGFIYFSDNLEKLPFRKYKFEFKPANKKIIINFNEAKPYTYLIIVPEYNNQQDEESENAPFEIGFVGALGKAIQTPKRKQNKNAFDFLKPKLIEEFERKKSALKFNYSINQTILNDPYQIQYVSSQNQIKRIQGYLQNNIPVDIKLQVDLYDCDANTLNQLDQLQIEGWKLIGVNLTKNHQIVSETQNHKNSQQDTSQFIELVSNHINKENKDRYEIIKTINLRCQKNKSLYKKFLEKVDLRQYISNVILTSNTHFEHFERFLENLIDEIKIENTQFLEDYVNRILQLVPTLNGLQLLLILVKKLKINHEVCSNVIRKILKRISSSRNSEYKNLRKNNNYGLALQKVVFSDYYKNLVESQTSKSKILFDHNKVLSKFVLFKTKFSRKYVIDLTNNIAVKNILLCFEASELKNKFYLRIYSVKPLGKTNYKKKLQFEHFYPESVWIQLTKNAYSPEMKKLFKNPIQSGLNSLGISNFNFSSRYLIIEVAFTIVPGTGNAREIQNLPTTEIIPEVFGEYDGQSQPLFMEYFNLNPKQLFYYNSVKFNQISNYEKYSLTKQTLDCFYYDNQQPFKPKQVKQKSKAITQSSTECLDYYYTVICLLFDTLTKKQWVDFSMQTYLSIFQVLVKTERGPICDKAVTILRKGLSKNNKLYIELLKSNINIENLNLYKDLNVREEIIKNQLENSPSKQFIRNSINIFKNNKINDLQLINRIIREASNINLDQSIIPFITNYGWTQAKGQFIKRLCIRNDTLARKIIKETREKKQLLEIAATCIQKEYNIFQIIVGQINNYNLQALNSDYQKIISKLLDWISKNDNQAVLKMIIKLIKTHNISKQQSKIFVNMFLQSNHKIKYLNQFLSLKILKENQIVSTILKYIIQIFDQAITQSNISLLNTMGVNHLLTFISNNLKTDLDSSPKIFIAKNSKRLIINSWCNYLNKLCLFNSVQGVKLPNVDIINKINFATLLFSLIDLKSLEEVNQDNMQKLIGWYLFNYYDKEQKIIKSSSNTTERYFGLIQNVFNFLIQSSKNQKNSKVILQSIFNKVNQFDSHIVNINQPYYKIIIQKRILRASNKLYSQILVNQFNLSYFMCDIGGFQYITKKINESTIEDLKIKQPIEKQIVNELVLVDSVNAPKDWLVNKVGTKNSLINLTFANEIASTYELLFKSTRPILLNKLILGFLVLDNPEKNNILPRDIQILVGQSLDQLKSIGKLDVLPDDYYLNFSTVIYGLNLNRIESSIKNYEDFVKEINKNRTIKYIKLVIKKPELISIADVIDVPQKTNKNNFASISFLSISGCDSCSYFKNLENILGLLQLITRTTNKDTLNKILRKSELVQRFKESLNTICILMQEEKYEKLLHPFILAVSKQNSDLGDYVLDKYLTLKNSSICANIVFDIITSDYEIIQSRIYKLHNFILSHLKNNSPQIKSLIPFIKKYINIIHLVSLDLRKQLKKIEIRIDLDQVKDILSISAANKFFEQSFIKLVSSLLLIKNPFVLSNSHLLADVLNYLWIQENRIKNYKLLAAFIIGKQESIGWFLSEHRIQSIFNNIKSILEDQSNQQKNNMQNLLSHINFLTDLSSSTKIKQIINNKDFNLDIFKKLTNHKNQYQLTKVSNTKLRKSLVDFMIASTSNTKSQKSLALHLKNSLGNLVGKSQSEFVYQIFLPLLNSYNSYPVVFNAYNSKQNKYIIQPNHILLKNQQPIANKQSVQALPNKFSSLMLTKTMKQKMHQLLKEPGQYQFGQNYAVSEMTLAYDSIKNRVLGNSFLILIKAKKGTVDVVLGVYYSKMNEEKHLPDSKLDTLNWNNQSFIFYFEEGGNLIHFKDKTNKPFILFESFDNSYDEFEQSGGEIVIHHNGLEKIYLEFTESPMINVELDKSMQSEQKIKLNLNEKLKITNFEYWIVKPTVQKVQKPSIINQIVGSSSNNLIFSSNYQKPGAINYLKNSVVYMIPGELKIKELKNMILILNVPLSEKAAKNLDFYHSHMHIKCAEDITVDELYKLLNKNTDNPVLELEYNAQQIYNQETIKQILSKQTKKNVPTIQFFAKTGVFKSFQQAKGVQKLIQVTNQCISGWKNKTKGAKWAQYIQELQSFSCFPYFFSVYMKQRQTVDLLFSLLAGLPDKQQSKKWDEMEAKAIKQLYKIVQQVLLLDQSLQFRQYSLKNNFITTVLERLHLLSKEQKRRFIKDFEQKQEQPKIIKPEVQDDGTKKIQKKKGVGYGNDHSLNTKWVAQDTTQSKKSAQQQIQTILSILQNFFNIKQWKIPKVLIDQIMSSCLLPLIQNTLRAGTLLQISKDTVKFHSILNLIKMIGSHQVLIPCILDLPKNYQPKQTQSIFSLLKSLKLSSSVFISCLGQNSSTQNNKATQDVAKQIAVVYDFIQNAIEDYNDSINKNQEEDQQKIQNILDLPLDKKYRELLKDLRFDYINMRDSNNKIKHHYAHSASVGNANKMIRLAQQLADLSTSLPIQHTNSIFVRCDKQRIDFMQALIMGASGTPYGHGAYLFDIHFEDNYPNGPPKVNITTTGNGKVRFNPNLYAQGKVCLSLLGTWRGNASENWDPKVSTLLQVLVSIQAIIMSEQIYFNEPGFQGQQGTQQGQKKNQAYSNIVRYANIKFAMIENIRNPPNGFQNIIRRHFYLKKEQILKQTDKWVKYAQKREANYAGLVNDHNSYWCSQFRKSKTKYLQMLQEANKQLKQQLQKLSPPSINDLISKRSPQKKKKKQIKQLKEIQQLNLGDIDVAYQNKEIENKQLNIDDETVKDRWSRYIGAMGIDAVSKQSKASVIIFGLGPMAMQVTKNIVLSGCKRVSLIDNNLVNWNDLSGGFFYGQSDIGKPRIKSCLNKIQELNQYVKVDTIQFNISKLEILKDYNVVFLSEYNLQHQIIINEYCRKNNIRFISADCYGPFSRIFNDFGDKFEVLDKNGQEPVQVMIKNISCQQKGLVTLLQGAKHPYEDGQIVIIKGVQGMQKIKEQKIIGEQSKSINGTLHKIIGINSNSFRIQNTKDFAPYIRNGTAKNLKLPVNLQFISLTNTLNLPLNKIPIDQNLSIYDFCKLQNTNIMHVCFFTLYSFIEKQKRTPSPWNLQDAQLFFKSFCQKWKQQMNQRIEKYVKIFSMTAQGNFPPLCAFIGGIVSQEIIKAITQKYKPIKSLFYCDFIQIVQDLPQSIKQWNEFLSKEKFQQKNKRGIGFQIVVGKQLVKKIQNCNLFMIGAGAIGCQLLKNYAMINLSVGQKGMITLTDPDHIQTSNLNRQFLFRQKHIQKPKSTTSAASVIQMNPLMKNHISARLDKIHDGTKDIYNNKFFQSLNIVTNALDNVAARRYVDQRCVENKVALLQSGTLGPKGHVQVIIPYLTQSYGSKNDPVQQGEIPHCTLKLFPEQTLHCVQWARDKFGHKFSLKPKAVCKIQDQKYKPEQSQIKTLRQTLKLLKKRPNNFDDCIVYAIKKFYKYYRDDVMQLLYTYPLDAKTKNGQPFWKLPKRPPTPIKEFNPQDILQCTFVTSLSVLIAKIHKIPYPKKFRTNQERFAIGKIASKIKILPFQPSDKKAKSIMKEQQKKGQQKEVQVEEENKPDEDYNKLFEQIKKILTKDIQISPEQFEKDDDSNGHIDFIYSMANLRSINYKLDSMDWITTKIKAGRIVPALSTTTTSISGLQTIQLCKYLKGIKLDKMRNAFLNLAVPVLQLSEPGTVQKVKLHQNLQVSIWDRWQVKCTQKSTFKDLFEQLQSTYKLKPKDIIQGSMPIYLSANMQIKGKQKQKESFLNSKLGDVLQVDQNYVDLIITFTHLQDNKILKSVPTVRLLF